MHRILKRIIAIYKQRMEDAYPNMFDKIIDNLYLGDAEDFKHCYVSKPYLFVDARGFYNTLGGEANGDELMVEPLMTISKACARLVEKGYYVMVYCQAGMERSPFLTALILFEMGKGTIQECYDFVKTKHPQTIQYSQWVNAYLDMRNKILSTPSFQAI
jgi:hypothetical protein